MDEINEICTEEICTQIEKDMKNKLFLRFNCIILFFYIK